MQNDREKFKKDFIERLIQFSVKILKLREILRENKVFWPVIDQLTRSATSIGAKCCGSKIFQP